MVTLNTVHYIYLIVMALIIIIMALKKDIIIPCILGLFLIGFTYTGSLTQGVQTIFNSLIVSGKSLWDVILIISLIVSMSSALKEYRVDELMLKPLSKLMINKEAAFFVLGIVMLIASWVIWPSPAVALVGAIILPAAIKAGLSPIWAAVAMNLFGHGMGLSSDFFIQGAPKITAEAAGLSSSQIITKTFPLWAVMSIITIITSFVMMKMENKKNPPVKEKKKEVQVTIPYQKGAYIVAIIAAIVLVIDFVCMITFELRGGDATALVGGSVLFIMIVCTIAQHGLDKAFDITTDHIKNGFIFGIKIFAAIIVIGAFFFIGGEETAKQIFGENATGIFNDLGLFLAQNVPLTKIPVIIVQSLVAFIVGFDGSGFSGLPLVGSLSSTFAQSVDIDQAGLASLGQIITIFVGGGTIIPWAVIPVAAICDVDPTELARKNIIPVSLGMVGAIVTAIIIF